MISTAFFERATPDQWRVVLARLKDAPIEVKRAAYRRYISSPAWKLNRFAVLARSDGRCECCGAECRVDVHHDTYDRVGNESLDDLRGLCRECHETAHGRKFRKSNRSHA